MAIVFTCDFTVGLYADGVSTSMSVDLSDAIAAATIVHNKTPIGVQSVYIGGAPGASGTVSGTIVTITWSTAPAAGPYSASVALQFNGV